MKKILVVDDESDVSVYLSRLFKENGFEAVCASGAQEALTKIEESKPYLITLDISMPEQSGAGLYRTIKSRSDLSTIPVVLVTGITGPSGSADTKRFYESRKHVPPPDGFVGKPIDPGEILGIVRKLT